MNIISRSQNETKKIARDILLKMVDGRHIIALAGELGVGKTVFAQGMGHIFGIDHLPSPTFTLMNVYHIKKNASLNAQRYSLFVHIDCYRLNNTQDIIDIGFVEYLDDPHALIVIEWADKIQTLLPQETVWLSFKHGSVENERIISVDTNY